MSATARVTLALFQVVTASLAAKSINVGFLTAVPKSNWFPNPQKASNFKGGAMMTSKVGQVILIARIIK